MASQSTNVSYGLIFIAYHFVGVNKVSVGPTLYCVLVCAFSVNTLQKVISEDRVLEHNN